MNIKNYAVIIEPTNCSCGVIVDPSEYSVLFNNDEFLNYSIDYKEKTLKIFSEKNEVYFHNMTEEFIYYAFKTDVFVLFIGDRFRKSPPLKAFEAFLV